MTDRERLLAIGRYCANVTDQTEATIRAHVCAMVQDAVLSDTAPVVAYIDDLDAFDASLDCNDGVQIIERQGPRDGRETSSDGRERAE